MTTSEISTGENTVAVPEPAATFALPDGAVHADSGDPVALSSIVSVVPATFTFRENANTPGRFLEQARAINVPAGAGFFTVLQTVSGGFTTNDFNFLTERPLGQFHASLGMRGNNVVCTVRLTDSNSDDPILVTVSGAVIFYN